MILRYPLLIILLFFSLRMSAFSHTAPTSLLQREWTMLAHINSKDFQKTFKVLTELDIDIAGVNFDNEQIDILINSYQYDMLQDNGFIVSVRETKGVTKKPDEEYKNPAEIAALVKDYHARFPEITELISIGKSLEGRDIWALKISDNPLQDEIEEPSILFNSMHHAREVMTPEISLDVIDYLLNNYLTDAKVADWVNKTQIWVIPMFNVDGNNMMWNRDSWWRKNTRGGYGVDLNRNYPAGWNSCGGSSGNRNSQTFRGDAPGSEPETQAMMNFISQVRPVFDISYHSYSEIVIYPYGCAARRTQTKEVVEKIGNHMAKLINYKPGTAWELLYNADGGDIDWMYEAYQVIPYVIELNSSSEGFHPRYAKWRDKTVERNRPAWQYLLDRVHDSGLRGVVKYASGKVLSDFRLQIYKMNNEDQYEFFQDYLGQNYGLFHLVLNPGFYRIEILKDKKILSSKTFEIQDKLEFMDIEINK